MKRAYIVLGLGFGDEGKGITTDFICKKALSPIVVRFNGGQQAGHTVVTKEGVRHVFSNFGSGTLREVPTYWSKYCTFSPAYFLCEYDILPVKPKIFVDTLCPVTTHYDVLYNRALEATRGKYKQGSCGVGFGATVARNDFDKIRLTVGDLFKPRIYSKKLDKIRNYYSEKINTETIFNFKDFDHESEDKVSLENIRRLEYLIGQDIIQLATEKFIFSQLDWKTYIFEGAQGILLDVDSGTHPFVTKSHTTSKNALQILNNSKSSVKCEIVYVTRAYLTRHGEGPFTKNETNLNLSNNKDETNIYNPYQGEFKTTYLSIDLLNSALNIDNQYSSHLTKKLIITCLDQVDANNIIVVDNGKYKVLKYQELADQLNAKFSNVSYSFSSCGDYIQEGY